MPLGLEKGYHIAGYISVQHTVWCGTCERWLQLDEGTKKEMILAIKMRGWKRVSNGAVWQCPWCVKMRTAFVSGT
jgi:hypothetical protein